MSYVATIPRSRRVSALLAVATAHVLFLLLILSARAHVRPISPKAGTLTVVSLADDPTPMPPTPQKLPPRFVRPAPILVPPATPQPMSAAAGATNAVACSTLDTVTKALIADPVAVAEVLASPPETRSIADAIIVWNAGWSDATKAAVPSLGEVRATVLQSLASTEDRCLDEPIAGPRLIPIPAGGGTMFLVFGSGNWRWRELLTDPDTGATQSPFEASPRGTRAVSP